MSESEIQGIVNQYRDWITPSTLLCGICLSVIIVSLTQEVFTKPLKTSVLLAFSAILFFLLNILYAFTRIEEIEHLNKNINADDGLLFILALAGIILTLLSITTLIFWKNKLLGICSLLFIFIAIYLFSLMV